MQRKLFTVWISESEYLSALEKKQFNEKSFYHSLTWLSLVTTGLGGSLRIIATKDSHGDLVAVTPFTYKKKGIFHFFGSPLRGMFTDYTGIIFRDDLSLELRELVLVSQLQFLKLRADYIELGFENDQLISESKIFSNLNFLNHFRPTLLKQLPLLKDDLFESFSGRARNMIRKSEKTGVKVLSIEPDDIWMEDYYNLLNTTFSKHGIKNPHSREFFLSLIKLRELNRMIFLEASINDEIVAKALFLINDDLVTYFSGTANALGFKSAATSAIQFNAMLIAQEMGISNFDMGGLGVPSIDKFKESFNGDKIHRNRWIYKRSLFRILEPIGLWLASKGMFKF